MRENAMSGRGHRRLGGGTPRWVDIDRERLIAAVDRYGRAERLAAPSTTAAASSASATLPRVSASDAERLLRFVAGAESIGGDQPFSPELLVELGDLIPADWVSYCELDRVRRRVRLLVVRPGEEEDDEIGNDVAWRVMLGEHPLCASRRGYFGAIKLSDFLTQRELHRTWVYENLRHSPRSSGRPRLHGT
jgi:hypothetical protein